MANGVYGFPLTQLQPLPPAVAPSWGSTTFVSAPALSGDVWRTGVPNQSLGTPQQPAATHMDPNSFWPIGIAVVSPVLALMGGTVGMVMGSAVGAGGAGLARGVGLGGSALGLLCTTGVVRHIVFEDLLKGKMPTWGDVSLALQCALVPGLTCLGVGLGLAMGAPWLAGFMGLFGSGLAYTLYTVMSRRQP